MRGRPVNQASSILRARFVSGKSSQNIVPEQFPQRDADIFMEPDNSAISREAEDMNEWRHHGVSFLDLPRELREMIYKHIPHNSGVTTYDTTLEPTKSRHYSTDVAIHPVNTLFQRRYGTSGFAFGSGEHCSAILSTCRTIYQEALPILYAATPLGIWRPMFDFSGSTHYSVFVGKVFSSLPVHASKDIRILQLQGELWQRNMVHLLDTAVAKLPCLRTLEVCLDPYYDIAERRNWFDDRAFSRQCWPAIAALHLVAQNLSSIDITMSPPIDRIWIVATDIETNTKVRLVDAALHRFMWLQLQLLVLKYEVTIYGALVHGDAKKGMEFFMDLLLERRDLFEMYQGRMLVRGCLDGTAEFGLEREVEWLRGITGRDFEVDEKDKQIKVNSGEKAEVKWCNFTYELRPRGLVAGYPL